MPDSNAFSFDLINATSNVNVKFVHLVVVASIEEESRIAGLLFLDYLGWTSHCRLSVYKGQNLQDEPFSSRSSFEIIEDRLFSSFNIF